jgi:tRNA threonylcarbamoyladenosine biosynthesis protein TsaB
MGTTPAARRAVGPLVARHPSPFRGGAGGEVSPTAMTILAIETTGPRAEVAVVDDAGVVASMAFQHRMELSRLLMPRIDATLEMAGMTLAELDGIAVSLGPGSFTGIRIGVVTAKALAWAAGRPLAGVPTLEALAAAEVASPETLICAVVPARADELYAALYQRAGGGAGVGRPTRAADAVTTRAAPTVLTIDQLAARLAGYPGPVLLAGDAPEAAERLLSALGPRALARRPPAGPAAAWVAEMGRQRLAAGGDDPATLAPLYVRPSAAVAKWG